MNCGRDPSTSVSRHVFVGVYGHVGTHNWKRSWPRPPPLGEVPDQDHPCKQASMMRMAREHEVLIARTLMSKQTDTQDTMTTARACIMITVHVL